MDSHLILEIAHEVVVTTVKSYQSHTHKCTCTQVPYILSYANNCCSQASQPSIEHVIIEICDDSITKENKELKEEVERLRRDLIQMKGKCNAQPSQDNHEYIVKNLEKESTDACIKPHQESHKSNSSKIKEKRKMMNKTPIICFKCNREGHHVRNFSLKKEEKHMSKI